VSDAARAEAQRLMYQGNDALRQGLYLDALKAFQQAYAKFPSPRLHFNLGQTYSELGRPLDALEEFEAFTTEVKRETAPEPWNIAYERAFNLRGSVVSIELQVNLPGAQITADGKAVGTAPLQKPLRLLPGSHALIVSKDGYEKQIIELSLKAGESATRLVELVTEEESAARGRVAQRLAEERRAAEERLRKVQEQEQNRALRVVRIERTTGAVSTGLGIGALIVGGVMAALSQSDAQAVEDARSKGLFWDQVSGQYDSALAKRTGSIVSFALGGALVITGVTLIGVSSRGPQAKEPQPRDQRRASSGAPGMSEVRLPAAL
jgi:tetratricopeptide (TPR) repeat protein